MLTAETSQPVTFESARRGSMAFEPLKSEDLALVNRLIQSHPDLQDTISVVKQVNAKAKYPITSFDELATALGGENGTVTFRGRTLTMAEARTLIPVYYFPIASESDLTAKMADLAKALPPSAASMAVATPIEAGIKMVAASAAKPSIAYESVSVEAIMKVAGASQTPSTGGLTRSSLVEKSL
jgi:hypothetical protein